METDDEKKKRLAAAAQSGSLGQMSTGNQMAQTGGMSVPRPPNPNPMSEEIMQAMKRGARSRNR